MMRKLFLSASAVALAAAGFGVASATSAYAGKPTITATSGHVHCNITAKVKLKPALKDDWQKSQHAGDPNSGVKNLPNTQFSPPAPEGVTAKGGSKGLTCTGTVTGTAGTATVTSITVSLVNDPAHPSSDRGTCLGLFHPTGPPSAARYNATVTYASSTAKITPTTITDAQIPQNTFSITGGTITGSFAAGTAAVTGVPDGNTLTIFGQENGGPSGGPIVATSSSPAAPDVCQPGLKIKGTTATLKAPKGFKGLSIVSSSTFDIHKP